MRQHEKGCDKMITHFATALLLLLISYGNRMPYMCLYKPITLPLMITSLEIIGL
nr:MAG TPA: hypothetical protein [Caudoviricetes sp.]